VNTLCGDSGLARAKLGWKPKMTFEQLMAKMVDEDLLRVRREIAAEKAAADLPRSG
jgi:GDPmannose 4,6-dehydratase